MAEPRNPPEAARKVTIALRANSDRASAQDQLGFKLYVKAIADFLKSTETRPPLVLSIEGEWGSGKTSFMLQLRNALEGKEDGDKPSFQERLKRFFTTDFITIWFNPWRYDQEEALWAAFALSFINQLTHNQVLHRRWWGHVRRFFARFRWREGWFDLLRKTLAWALLVWLMGFIAFEAIYAGASWNVWAYKLYEWITHTPLKSQDPLVWGISAGGVTAYLALLAGLFHWLKPLIEDPLKADLRKYISGPNYSDRIPFIDRFQDDFKSMLDAYVGRGQKAAIFIDDLDRCEVPRAADLMAALNLMITDDPRLIFILGMDSEKVAAGLAVKYEKLLPYLQSESAGEAAAPQGKVQNGIEFGYEFIKKFVQLPFVLPRPDQNQLDTYLKELSESKPKPVPRPKDLNFPRRRAETLQRRQARPGPTSGQGPGTASGTARRESLPPALGSISHTGPTPVLAAEAHGPREELLSQLGEDSAAMQKIVEDVKPKFENNPRWIRPRSELLHLTARLAVKAGLFDSGADSRPLLTLQQLARFITLRARWPLLYQDILAEPALLPALQQAALSPPPQQDAREKKPPQPERLELWRSNPDLMDFMAAGCKDTATGEMIPEHVLSLEGDNLQKLLNLMELQELQQSRPRQEIITQGSEDSEAFREVVKTLIPTFKNNPRRLKLFTNLLRLRAYIAEETGLFDDDFSPGAYPPPTLGQLGKFITISLCWPTLFNDIENDPRLLIALQQAALEETPGPANRLDRWRGQTDLVDLLKAGCWDAATKKIIPQKGYDWVLEDINLERLLRVSPLVRSIARQEAPQAVQAPLQVAVKEAAVAKEAVIVTEKPIKPIVAEVTPLSWRVLAITFDPIQDGKHLPDIFGWGNPDKLIDQLIADLTQASHGLFRPLVVQRQTVNRFPAKEDGFIYTFDDYIHVMQTKAGWHQPDTADYGRILADYDIPARINQNEIDEVWLFGFPYAGLFESRMGGQGAFWCNGPPLESASGTTRRFVIMGFSCERGVGEMLEAFGHRAEFVLSQVYRNYSADQNLFDQFKLYDKVAPGRANCGTMHFAPNSLQDYDWANTSLVTSNCDDWLNFPDMKGVTRQVNCTEWGKGDVRLHHLWWLEHLPHAPGATNGVLNNWWQYIADPTQVR